MCCSVLRCVLRCVLQCALQQCVADVYMLLLGRAADEGGVLECVLRCAAVCVAMCVAVCVAVCCRYVSAAAGSCR